MTRKNVGFIRLLAVILLCALLIGSLAACRGMGEGEISVFYYTYADTYISSVRSAMDKALRDAGLMFNNYDANSMQTTQTEQIDTAIAKGSRMLLVNIVDTGSDDAAKAIISKAKAADIPVIFFNRSVSEEVVKSYDKCLFIGTDYEMAGHMQGTLIGNYLVDNYDELDLNGDGKISYVLFKGQQGNAEAEARTKYSVEDCNSILIENGFPALSFYDSKNTGGYLVDQGGNWSSQAANDYMKTILSAHSESGRNMIELVISNNDEMALGAISALNEAGYNKAGGKVIPVFGVDATDGAIAKIKEGAMTGTIRQSGEDMAKMLAKVTENMLGGKDTFDGVDKDYAEGSWRINIPYSVYTGEDGEK